MRGFRLKGLLQKEGWISPAYIKIDDQGRIISVGSEEDKSVKYEEIKGLALPAFPNAHSHAFQYAMAGLAEVHPTNQAESDFWSWRRSMYEIALSVDPEDMESIAAMLYAEMLRHGYSNVVEFHYLHHDKNGKPYSNMAEMGERLIAAAKTAGINITLVPMLYQKGGFNQPPEQHQRRFISSTDQYVKLIEQSEDSVECYDHANTGYGVHSLRAAEKESISSIIQAFQNKFPFHIHVSEQLKEVEEALTYLKQRPVEWLLSNFDVDHNFNLVHATHLNDNELIGIAEAGANVVLCPSTEGNLGDGIFRFHDFQAKSGRWCIGTDSHIGLNPFEELRLLDYGQRLTSHKRNTFAPSGGEGASNAFKNVIDNGRLSAGFNATEYFESGSPFNAVIIDQEHPLFVGSADYWLSTIVYHCDASDIYGILINGQWKVKEGKHLHIESIQKEFVKTLNKLKIRNR